MSVDQMLFRKAVARLDYIRTQNYPEIQEIIDAEGGVLTRYQPMFSLNNIPELTADNFKSFLFFTHNKHWSYIYRTGGLICQNMVSLHSALRTLHDDSQPIEVRWDTAIRAVNGLGKAILSAILLVMYPGDYGVWNTPSENALKTLRIWPNFKRGMSGGQRYTQINNVLRALAKDGDLDVDLWTLDALMWGMNFP